MVLKKLIDKHKVCLGENIWCEKKTKYCQILTIIRGREKSCQKFSSLDKPDNVLMFYKCCKVDCEFLIFKQLLILEK